jgi:hypothetical protein
MTENNRSCRIRPSNRKLLNTLVVRKNTETIGPIADSIADKSVTPAQNINTIAVWDAVHPCMLSLCELRYDCPYYVEMPTQNAPPCAVQTNYLRYLYKNLVTRNAKYLTQQQLDQIGYHLLPLYGHLIKFKMVEYTLNLNGVGVHGGIIVKNPRSGMSAIHPIYREIRQTLSAIDTLWQNIGLNKMGVEKAALPVTKDLFEWGDPDYVDNLTNGAFGDMSSETAESL